ncbi:MAG: hypothetical protein DI568_16280 [Sphingomonas sp.]|nr:MAG: hypothetical protein DI568_16280 [Sphingomonas sp.]
MSPDREEVRTDEAVRAEAVAWLARLRAGEVATDHLAFEDWYIASPRHSDIYDEVLKNWEAMAVAAQTPAAQARASAFRPSVSRMAGLAALAAGVAALLLLASGDVARRAGLVAGDTATPVHYTSGVGEIRSVDLPDGSMVTLDTDSRVSLLYTAGERRLRLDSGRARFRVAHDDPRPFLVEAGDAVVLAHGTVFDVDLGGPRVEVALLEGAVEVRQSRSADTAAPAPGPRQLKPGQRLQVDARAVPQPVDPDDFRWTSGMLSFQDAGLGEVVAASNRYNTTKLLLGDPALAKLRFSGTFNAREPAALADSFASMFGLTVTRNDDGSIRLAKTSGPEK